MQIGGPFARSPSGCIRVSDLNISAVLTSSLPTCSLQLGLSEESWMEVEHFVGRCGGHGGRKPRQQTTASFGEHKENTKARSRPLFE